MIKKVILTGALAVVLLLSSSCSVFIVKVLGLTGEEVEEIVLVNGDRKIVFFPMHHIGVAGFYEDVGIKVDSLHQLGYIGLYEMVGSDHLDSLEKREMKLKFRKITGIGIPEGKSYIDLLKSAGAQDLIEKHNLVDQPAYYELNVDTSTAIRADLSLDEVIGAFEEDYGEIVLTACDYATGLDEDYRCDVLPGKEGSNFRKNYMIALRNKEIARTVDECPASKIYVIYGAAHFNGFLKDLRGMEPGWHVQ